MKLPQQDQAINTTRRLFRRIRYSRPRRRRCRAASAPIRCPAGRGRSSRGWRRWPAACRGWRSARFLADQRAVGVVAVAADPGDPADVREVDAPRVGAPEGAADDPAVGTVQLRVVRLERALFLDGVEGGPLEGWLVPFHEQEVVRFPVAVLFPAMYSAVSRWAWTASAVTTALSRSTASSNSRPVPTDPARSTMICANDSAEQANSAVVLADAGLQDQRAACRVAGGLDSVRLRRPPAALTPDEGRPYQPGRVGSQSCST
jgi:hypothetical protein